MILDIKKIVGNSLNNVNKILGQFDSKEPVNPASVPNDYKVCEKASYQNGKFEVVFIDGIADWITVKDLKDYSFDENSLKLLGLEYVNPSFSNHNVIRWNNIKPFEEITVFSTLQGKIDYIYIKALTK